MKLKTILNTFSAIALAFSLNVIPAQAATPININQANATELTQLSGVGPAKAKAIIAYRKSHGAFKNVAELTQVKGIGPKLIEHDQDQIRVK
ncbi:ComEA family DNA-binding protein [Celerinatantimonas yamalensis]|uniref:Helix-hairpin-helix domain-containing protein n=1 Tax=Celerinatantimonas yamalensis TaxID=559956 RepID=A0ABW9G642_9GAMM